MRGLVVWAYSECRSMMGLYRALQRSAPFPIVIATYHQHSFKGFNTVRTATGFSLDEFSDASVIPVGESWNIGKKILDEHPGFSHLFAVYQGAHNFLNLMKEIKRRGEKFGCICESPCNMSTGIKGWMKGSVYLKHILPFRVRQVVKDAEFLVNLSGDCSDSARAIGWSAHKIIPWGYFSPPIPESHMVKRVRRSTFSILVTGAMTWHRAPDVALKAMRLLSQWHVPYECIFTQNGPLLETLKQAAQEYQLPIKFPGLLPMPDLIKLYESCSVYVAAGRHEPWGMRLNDALQCGSPIVVSRGMGGVKMVDDYGCGAAFYNEDYVGLAWQLKRLAEDKELYEKVAQRAYDAAQQISPEKKAKELLGILERIF